MEIDIKDFEKLDLRVGEIKEVNDILGSDKLFLLKIDVGELKQVVAGIRNSYKKEDLEGKQVVVLNNLKPAKIRGIESKGMILAAIDGKPFVLVPDRKVRNGSMIQ